MPVTTMFHSDSTDKVRRYHNWCSSSHRHEMLEQPDGMYVRASDYYALQARYDALKAAGEDMEAAIRSLDHTVAHPLYASECPVCIALDTYCDIAFRAATGKGQL